MFDRAHLAHLIWPNTEHKRFLLEERLEICQLFVISTGIPRTSSQNKHVVPNHFCTAILVRKGKTIEFSIVTVHKVHKNLEQWIL